MKTNLPTLYFNKTTGVAHTNNLMSLTEKNLCDAHGKGTPNLTSHFPIRENIKGQEKLQKQRNTRAGLNLSIDGKCSHFTTGNAHFYRESVGCCIVIWEASVIPICISSFRPLMCVASRICISCILCWQLKG